MNNLTSYSFFKLIKKLEKDYGRKNIFLRTNKSLKHPNKDIEKIVGGKIKFPFGKIKLP